jgi:redox-sensitive bicupin YhaK (pirin superfamily)
LDRFKGVPTSDGAGVKLTRIIGSPQLSMLDPFLLLDCFESDQPQDYLAGFPEHPHRGFETVTYLLNGRMRHKDSAGHEGIVEPGGVQWMTAGKGILHSEMPEQTEGLLKGFQLWVNLPASAKMTEPAYQEFPPESTPLEYREDGTLIRVISGQTDQGTIGAVRNDYVDPTYMDISLPEGSSFLQSLPENHNAFVYVIEGELRIDGKIESYETGESGKHSVLAGELGILSKGRHLTITSGLGGTRFLLISGLPLNEPIVRAGPFVMNTRTEILQAFDDFSRNSF